MKQRLDQLVGENHPQLSRNQIQALIMAGQVLVEGRPVTKPGAQVAPGSKISLKELPKYVSRGGDKLAGAVAKFKLDFKGKTVLDVGASTGGFSDYALQHGAARVYTVDVGTGQLAWRLRQDERVVVREKTDIRDLPPLKECCALALVDVSFISLRQVLPAVEQHLCSNGRMIVLVKPQFEATKQEADLHKGVIKNDTIRRRIIKQFEEWARPRYRLLAKADSDLKGAKGNTERFYLLAPLKR